MRALICVFSGTGNTKRVCEELKREWEARGNEADIFSIRKGEKAPDLEEYDLLIAAYPVHAFNAPAPFLKFLKKLPKRKGESKPAYLVRTSGEPVGLNHASGITPKRILKKRGYSVLGEYAFVMPYNIIFRHSDKMVSRMWKTATGRMATTAREMEEGKGVRYKINPFKRMVSFVLRIEHTAMPVVGKTFHTSKKKCIGCGLCAKVCPQGNIKMVNGRPKFKGSCVACMACAFTCPKDAVRTSLLNAWRVNGKYSFEGEPATDGEVCRYCRRAYLRYFHENEKAN